jgi:hypothetical protein
MRSLKAGSFHGMLSPSAYGAGMGERITTSMMFIGFLYFFAVSASFAVRTF